MAGALKETATFRDAKGNTATVSFYVASTGTQITQATAAQSVLTPLAALSNAFLQNFKGPDNKAAGPVVYGTNASYASVEDKAIFTFQSATGAIHRFQVPAPIASIFLADGETVDASNTAVTAFVSAVIANAFTRDGEAIAFGAFGTRIRRKLHRRINIFTKDPTLTEPAE